MLKDFSEDAFRVQIEHYRRHCFYLRHYIIAFPVNWFSRIRTRRYETDSGSLLGSSEATTFSEGLSTATMPDNCKSMTLRDANNNTYPAPVNNNINRSSNIPGPKQRSIQVTAKVLFGSVHAINRLKEAEKAARENKRI
ncbi:hypothetical protein HUJ05_009954 [Dendroctonus ponderosae]|nr:hypothetical protein HUJ05_009954 [Dendroctonus ponderosae]